MRTFALPPGKGEGKPDGPPSDKRSAELKEKKSATKEPECQYLGSRLGRKKAVRSSPVPSEIWTREVDKKHKKGEEKVTYPKRGTGTANEKNYRHPWTSYCGGNEGEKKQEINEGDSME